MVFGAKNSNFHFSWPSFSHHLIFLSISLSILIFHFLELVSQKLFLFPLLLFFSTFTPFFDHFSQNKVAFERVVISFEQDTTNFFPLRVFFFSLYASFLDEISYRVRKYSIFKEVCNFVHILTINLFGINIKFPELTTLRSFSIDISNDAFKIKLVQKFIAHLINCQ